MTGNPTLVTLKGLSKDIHHNYANITVQGERVRTLHYALMGAPDGMLEPREPQKTYPPKRRMR